MGRRTNPSGQITGQEVQARLESVPKWALGVP